MSSVQVRISLPYEDAMKLIESDYVSRARQALAFQHEADDEVSRTHTHFYLFGLPLSRPDDAVRDHLRKHLAKTEYMASMTAKKGKRELTPQAAYTYGTKSLLKDPMFYKGFEMDELKAFAEEAKKFYAPKTEKVLIIHQTEQKPDNVWSYFLEKMMDKAMMGDTEMTTWNQTRFKKWIMADYLNRLRPIPREADLNRYAFSLWMLRFHVGKDYEKVPPLKPEDIDLTTGKY